MRPGAEFNACDESHLLATLQDLGSVPAGMSSGKFLDFLGHLDGWTLAQADTVFAFTQAALIAKCACVDSRLLCATNGRT